MPSGEGSFIVSFQTSTGLAESGITQDLRIDLVTSLHSISVDEHETERLIDISRSGAESGPAPGQDIQGKESAIDWLLRHRHRLPVDRPE